ncbi:hypothetical protein CERZMDRAFT_93877 [Cercospora zeae-maydis SCOH1-5]|uniref:Uncharacterized protein n=1 Tax=Cercospora zeae-maydis SCOH1-5 TaxID=717836 RepID=A0A6A6FTE6_9PEZI|nr:hypothetical protein CERZMDRAFT_93877 [Cercospora zeae-maydis SCOH1-5]
MAPESLQPWHRRPQESTHLPWTHRSDYWWLHPRNYQSEDSQTGGWLSSNPSDSTALSWGDECAVCSMLEIVQLLDVPHIGDDGIFSYHADDYVAYHLFQSSIYGRKLSLANRAALLEHISID